MIRKKQWHKFGWIISVTAAVIFTPPAGAFATESITLPLQGEREDVVSVELPAAAESEAFDFILDPHELIYRTGAARYGGGVIEEGATLLFHNKEGEYDFSRYSDKLSVMNRSTVPVNVTISACVSNLEEVDIAENDDFSGNENCSIYLAIVDDEGNVQPISADGKTSVNVTMREAPENAYVYRMNEDLQSYEYSLSGDLNEIDFDAYSFGLVGACNPNADWNNISVCPTVTVTWHVEPVLPEQEETLDKNDVNAGEKKTENPEEEDPSETEETENPEEEDPSETEETENPEEEDPSETGETENPEEEDPSETGETENSEQEENPETEETENPNQEENPETAGTENPEQEENPETEETESPKQEETSTPENAEKLQTI